MTNEERLDRLIEKMVECQAKNVVSLPEQGRFEPHAVTISYPGTDWNGRLLYEYDLVDSSQRSRRLRAALCREGSDRMVSCYLFKGSKAECLTWLGEKENQQVLKKKFAGLLDSADR